MSSDSIPPEEAVRLGAQLGDGDLHLWECPRIMPLGTPRERSCGFVARAVPGSEPGFCPYDHGERVRLVPLTATAQCSDCEMPVPADDCRAPDGRLVCPNCVMSYIGQYEEERDHV
jgi:hypothetical protein